MLLLFWSKSWTTSANRACIPSIGVFFSSQELWKTTQQFTITAMRDLGMGKHLGEVRMLEELRFLIELSSPSKVSWDIRCFMLLYKATVKTSGLLQKWPVQLCCSFLGRPFQLWFLNMAPSNITFAILFGRRFDYGNPTFLTLLRLIDEVMHLLGSSSLHISCPLCWDAPVSHLIW